MQRKNMIERKRNPEQKGRTILRNILITVGIMGAATIVCLALQHFSEADTHVPLLFVLAVVIVARFTEGYVYGILSAMAAVVLVNYVFTYPYFELNFSITGYPLTFVVMLATAVMVSALTTQIKWQEQIRLEVEKEKTRANLLRAVSHDIRTPLTLIKAPLEELRNGDMVNEEGKTHVGMALRNVDVLLRLTTNLINFERIDTYSSRLYVSEYELGSYMAGICDTFRSYASVKHIRLDYENNFNYLNVWFDRDKMDSILKNILSNAMKYTPENGRIHVSVSECEDSWRIEVKDTGIGIDRKSVV